MVFRRGVPLTVSKGLKAFRRIPRLGVRQPLSWFPPCQLPADVTILTTRLALTSETIPDFWQEYPKKSFSPMKTLGIYLPSVF